MTTEIVKAADAGLEVLADDPTAVLDAFQSTGEAITVGDLGRVKFPSGGAKASFQLLDELTGEVESLSEVTGVIVATNLRRAYWKGSDPVEGVQPDCSSPDAELGYGEPGDALRANGKGCADCPNSQFGSAEKGGGQACNLYRDLYLLRPGVDPLPLIVSLPAASVGAARKYLFGLARNRLKAPQVLTTVRLERVNNKAGTAYSEARLSLAGRLDPETATRAEEYADAFDRLLSSPRSAAAGEPPVEADADDEDQNGGGAE